MRKSSQLKRTTSEAQPKMNKRPKTVEESKLKRPKDINQLAKEIVDISTGEKEDFITPIKKREADAKDRKAKELK